MTENKIGIDWLAQATKTKGATDKNIFIAVVREDSWGEVDDDKTRALLWKIVEGCEPWFLINRLPYVEGNKMKVELVLKEGVE